MHVTSVKKVLNALIIDGIKYEKIGSQIYDVRLFEPYEIHKNDLTFSVTEKNKTIYNKLMPLDSGVETDFAKECESRDDIEFYFKLPFWFKINTPIGGYNPDWVLIKKNQEALYFVAETKGEKQELRPSEKIKVKCGKAHFREFEGVRFKQVTTVGDLD